MDRFEGSRKHFLAGAAAVAAAACTAGGALAAGRTPRSEVPAEKVFASLVRALVAFDDPRFPDVTPDELIARIAAIANVLADPAYRAGLVAFDASSVPAFSTLSLANARNVVDRWQKSPDARQRAFVSTSKAVAVIALYSDPRSWEAIGYAGPFDPKLSPTA